MGTKIKSIAVAIATFTMLFIFAQSPASNNQSDVPDSGAQLVANLDGNPNCQAISNNSNIKEVKVYHPGSSGSPILEGLQTIDYHISRGGVLSWSVESNGDPEPDVPINSVIITSKNGHKSYSSWNVGGKSDKSKKSEKSKKHKNHKGKMGVRVYHFGDEGAPSDQGETGQGRNITKIRFCYGLVEEGPPTQAFDDIIPDCSETGISCPANSDEPMLFIGLSLLNPNFDPSSESEDEKDSWCTCGNIDGQALVLKECDPAADAGTENACNLPAEDEGGGDYPHYYSDSSGSSNGDDDVADGVVPRVPVLIQAVETPDSYVCRVRAGRRRCYNH